MQFDLSAFYVVLLFQIQMFDHACCPILPSTVSANLLVGLPLILVKCEVVQKPLQDRLCAISTLWWAADISALVAICSITSLVLFITVRNDFFNNVEENFQPSGVKLSFHVGEVEAKRRKGCCWSEVQDCLGRWPERRGKISSGFPDIESNLISSSQVCKTSHRTCRWCQKRGVFCQNLRVGLTE